MLPRRLEVIRVWEAGLRGKVVLIQTILQLAGDPDAVAAAAAAARVANVRVFNFSPLYSNHKIQRL